MSVRKIKSHGNIGKHHSNKVRMIISIAHKGKHHSPNTEFEKGMTPWNKGKKRQYSMGLCFCNNCKELFIKNSPSQKNCKKCLKIVRNNWFYTYLKNPDKRMKKNVRLRTMRKIPLTNECEICSSTNNLQRHHIDYSKPFEIKIVCSKCHWKIHHPTKSALMERSSKE